VSIALALFLLNPLPADWPFVPGTSWEYRELSREKVGPIWSASETETRFTARGSERRPFLHQEGGVDPSSGPIERGAGWVRLLPWTGEEALPWPLEVGATGPAADDGTPGWRVEGEETVSVPAGDYRAFRCALRTSASWSILWIAPDIGIVREEHGVPGDPAELERVLLRRQVPSGAPSGPSPPKADEGTGPEGPDIESADPDYRRSR
jgi:hypothetical protein